MCINIIRWAPQSRVAWPPAAVPAFGDGATTTTVTTTNGQSENLRLHQYPTGSFVQHHPLSILPQPFAYYPVPLQFLAAAPAPTEFAAAAVAAKKAPGKNKNPKTAPESTTASSPFNQNRPSHRLRPNEKLVLPATFGSGRALPLNKNKAPISMGIPANLLPPKFSRPETGAYLPPQPISKPFKGHRLPSFAPVVDYKLVGISQYQKPTYKYIIDKIAQVPGELLAKLVAKERLFKSHFAPKPEKVYVYHHRYEEPRFPTKFVAKPSNMYLPAESQPERTTTTTTEAPVMVEATNELDANIVLPNGENVILLQPSARAVSGKDGTSIANPISRVLLKKNRQHATTILYRPQAVAISGPGGTAHAQSDLIIDYLDE